MKIVKFKDGTYAVRELTFTGYMYKDIKGEFWWSFGSRYFRNCKGDLDTIKKLYIELTDKGTPIN